LRPGRYALRITLLGASTRRALGLVVTRRDGRLRVRRVARPPLLECGRRTADAVAAPARRDPGRPGGGASAVNRGTVRAAAGVLGATKHRPGGVATARPPALGAALGAAAAATPAGAVSPTGEGAGSDTLLLLAALGVAGLLGAAALAPALARRGNVSLAFAIALIALLLQP
jgi:hypothetical protein